MKATGNIRKVDHLGRVSLTQVLKEKNISSGDFLEIYFEDNYILLKKALPKCIFCGSEKGVKQIIDKYICIECHSKIKQM